MRRLFIYPHRSLRAVPLNWPRCALSALIAGGLTLAIVRLLQPLFALHNQLCLGLLHLSGIPVTGIALVQLFAAIQPVPVPLVAVTQIGARPLELWSIFAAAMLLLLELHRRIPFARSLLSFLMVLLIVALGVVIFDSAAQFGSAEFATIWLRGELLIWFVLPWFSASMLILMQPATVLGIGWALISQIYGFFWSAIRLALCIGVMHYTGILFAPMFWFVLGVMADVVYLVVFYSVGLQWTSRRWDTRTN